MNLRGQDLRRLKICCVRSRLLHRTLVLTCAATALRSSEILALRWADILWEEKRIRVSKRWADGKDGQTKTDASDRTDMFRCIPSWRSICKSGRLGRPTGKTRTSCFLPQRQKVAFPSPLPRSSPTISGRPRRKPGCRSKTGSGLGFTTYGTRLRRTCHFQAT
jgi:integrase